MHGAELTQYTEEHWGRWRDAIYLGDPQAIDALDRLLIAMGKAQLSPLTERELDILTLLSYGDTRNEVGSRLWISPETVKTHTKHIREKLQARNTSHAVSLAIQKGLI